MINKRLQTPFLFPLLPFIIFYIIYIHTKQTKQKGRTAFKPSGLLLTVLQDCQTKDSSRQYITFPTREPHPPPTTS